LCERVETEEIVDRRPARRVEDEGAFEDLEEAMRKYVSETDVSNPLSRCARQPMIEANVEDQVFAGGIAERPQVADRVAARKRLVEVPDFAGEREFVAEAMWNREALTELGLVSGSLGQGVEHGVRVIVESLDVGTGQQHDGIQGAAEIEFRSRHRRRDESNWRIWLVRLLHRGESPPALRGRLRQLD